MANTGSNSSPYSEPFRRGVRIPPRAYVGNNLELLSTSLAFVIGACLGSISELAAGLIMNAGSRKSDAAAASDAAAVAHN